MSWYWVPLSTVNNRLVKYDKEGMLYGNGNIDGCLDIEKLAMLQMKEHS